VDARRPRPLPRPHRGDERLAAPVAHMGPERATSTSHDSQPRNQTEAEDGEVRERTGRMKRLPPCPDGSREG
jgi:hypothetical protein